MSGPILGEVARLQKLGKWLTNEQDSVLPLEDRPYDLAQGAEQLSHAKQRIRALSTKVEHQAMELGLLTEAVNKRNDLLGYIKETLLHDALLLVPDANTTLGHGATGPSASGEVLPRPNASVGNPFGGSAALGPMQSLTLGSLTSPTNTLPGGGGGSNSLANKKLEYKQLVVTTLDEERLAFLHNDMKQLLQKDQLLEKDRRIAELENREQHLLKVAAEKQKAILEAQAEKHEVQEKLKREKQQQSQHHALVSTMRSEIEHLKQEIQEHERKMSQSMNEQHVFHKEADDQKEQLEVATQQIVTLQDQLESFQAGVENSKESLVAAVKAINNSGNEMVRFQEASIMAQRLSPQWASWRSKMQEGIEKIRGVMKGDHLDSVDFLQSAFANLLKVTAVEIGTVKNIGQSLTDEREARAQEAHRLEGTSVAIFRTTKKLLALMTEAASAAAAAASDGGSSSGHFNPVQFAQLCDKLSDDTEEIPVEGFKSAYANLTIVLKQLFSQFQVTDSKLQQKGGLGASIRGGNSGAGGGGPNSSGDADRDRFSAGSPRGGRGGPLGKSGAGAEATSAQLLEVSGDLKSSLQRLIVGDSAGSPSSPTAPRAGGDVGKALQDAAGDAAQNQMEGDEVVTSALAELKLIHQKTAMGSGTVPPPPEFNNMVTSVESMLQLGKSRSAAHMRRFKALQQHVEKISGKVAELEAEKEERANAALEASCSRRGGRGSDDPINIVLPAMTSITDQLLDLHKSVNKDFDHYVKYRQKARDLAVDLRSTVVSATTTDPTDQATTPLQSAVLTLCDLLLKENQEPSTFLNALVLGPSEAFRVSTDFDHCAESEKSLSLRMMFITKLRSKRGLGTLWPNPNSEKAVTEEVGIQTEPPEEEEPACMVLSVSMADDASPKSTSSDKKGGAKHKGEKKRGSVIHGSHADSKGATLGRKQGGAPKSLSPSRRGSGAGRSKRPSLSEGGVSGTTSPAVLSPRKPPTETRGTQWEDGVAPAGGEEKIHTHALDSTKKFTSLPSYSDSVRDPMSPLLPGSQSQIAADPSHASLSPNKSPEALSCSGSTFGNIAPLQTMVYDAPPGIEIRPSVHGVSLADAIVQTEEAERKKSSPVVSIVVGVEVAVDTQELQQLQQEEEGAKKREQATSPTHNSPVLPVPALSSSPSSAPASVLSDTSPTRFPSAASAEVETMTMLVGDCVSTSQALEEQGFVDKDNVDIMIARGVQAQVAQALEMEFLSRRGLEVAKEVQTDLSISVGVTAPAAPLEAARSGTITPSSAEPLASQSLLLGGATAGGIKGPTRDRVAGVAARREKAATKSMSSSLTETNLGNSILGASIGCSVGPHDPLTRPPLFGADVNFNDSKVQAQNGTTGAAGIVMSDSTLDHPQDHDLGGGAGHAVTVRQDLLGQAKQLMFSGADLVTLWNDEKRKGNLSRGSTAFLERLVAKAQASAHLGPTLRCVSPPRMCQTTLFQPQFEGIGSGDVRSSNIPLHSRSTSPGTQRTRHNNAPASSGSASRVTTSDVQHRQPVEVNLGSKEMRFDTAAVGGTPIHTTSGGGYRMDDSGQPLQRHEVKEKNNTSRTTSSIGTREVKWEAVDNPEVHHQPMPSAVLAPDGKTTIGHVILDPESRAGTNVGVSGGGVVHGTEQNGFVPTQGEAPIGPKRVRRKEQVAQMHSYIANHIDRHFGQDPSLTDSPLRHRELRQVVALQQQQQSFDSTASPALMSQVGARNGTPPRPRDTVSTSTAINGSSSTLEVSDGCDPLDNTMRPQPEGAREPMAGLVPKVLARPQSAQLSKRATASGPDIRDIAAQVCGLEAPVTNALQTMSPAPRPSSACMIRGNTTNEGSKKQVLRPNSALPGAGRPMGNNGLAMVPARRGVGGKKLASSGNARPSSAGGAAPGRYVPLGRVSAGTGGGGRKGSTSSSQSKPSMDLTALGIVHIPDDLADLLATME